MTAQISVRNLTLVAGIALASVSSAVQDPIAISFTVGLGMPFSPTPLGQSGPGVVITSNNVSIQNGDRVFELDGISSTATPIQFDVHVRNRHFHSGSALQIECWQWASSQWITIEFRPQTPGIWHTSQVAAIDPLTGVVYAGLVDPLTLAMRLRISARQISPPNVFNPTTAWDYAYWDVL